MTFEEMKKLLLEYPEMTKKVYKLNEEVKDIEESIKAIRNISAINYDTVSIKGKIKDSTSDKVEKIIDIYEKRLNKILDNIEEVYETQTKITDMLSKLTKLEREILEARYLKDIKWDYIPLKVPLSRANCFKNHDSGINKMIHMLDNDDEEKYEAKPFGVIKNKKIY